ncbi:beta-propeller fold lactonase family protein [Mesobacillus selenatarsenatis]|uniref:Beta-propeller fold lactonase family protein n=1 Tax=Mesobacillus selenatarsenatis TaxID=388741 RepID=A0A846TZV3_9BACI|nr:beta-propeller fold lactonase family protein [Mesobacillus selenatarsenatis]
MKKLILFLLAGLIAVSIAGCTKKASGTMEFDITRDYAVNSNNIIMNKKGTMIYTANIDISTVSFFDTKKQKVVAEVKVGREPRQMTLSPDENYLYVANMYDNKIDIVSIKDEKVIGSLETGIEPFGVVTSQDGKTLYVANYRSGTVSVFDLQHKKQVEEIEVGDRPRSLAITADGSKIYVPQYLNGSITVIDTVGNEVVKEIQLAQSPDKSDVKKSQGIPNSLEQFVISPDGKTAWVPHMLTNIDTPIHFEETIFPAISVIDLERDEEIIDKRKELFDEINVSDSKNQTIIVSNPYDIVFKPDGSKAYAVMSGSEDLVVFDLNRGGNATQIVRRINGDNPRGAVVSPDGESLFVHNAMSHDMSVLKAGGGTYSRVKAAGENIALVSNDPMDPLEREGKKIFYSANSDEYAAEITGNNWMSCASCHADGDMNGLTLQTPKGPRNVPSNVLTTKTGLFMWDGSRDDFEDYLLTVQGEMGGMMKYDAGNPLPEDIAHMYDAMFAFLDNPESFPPPKSPYRLKDGELSEAALEGKELFEGKAGCLSCHGGNNFTDSVKAVDRNGQLTTDNQDFLYDIGTSNTLDKESAGDARAAMKNPRDQKRFDTPTLRGVWATAPYFHDGSAKTLEDAISRHNTKELSGLTRGEITKIAEYVGSLE